MLYTILLVIARISIFIGLMIGLLTMHKFKIAGQQQKVNKIGLHSFLFMGLYISIFMFFTGKYIEVIGQLIFSTIYIIDMLHLMKK